MHSADVMLRVLKRASCVLRAEKRVSFVQLFFWFDPNEAARRKLLLT